MGDTTRDQYSFSPRPKRAGKPLTFIVKNLLLGGRMVIDATKLKSEVFAFVLRVWDLNERGLV